MTMTVGYSNALQMRLSEKFWQWVNTELWFRRFADGKVDVLNVA